MENTAKIVDDIEEKPAIFAEPTENEKELIKFILEHTDEWREYRNQNFLDNWDKYERIFRGTWEINDKTRESERSKVISPATQQAIETRHAEIMEAIFGQGDFFDIKDDVKDQNGKIDVELLKNQLKEEFAQDKIRKSIDQIALLGEIYGTGIGEISMGYEKTYKPAQMPLSPTENQYGVMEKDRFYVKLTPINPKNFIFDPNGTSIDDCMGVAIERTVSIHKIAEGIASGKYLEVDIGSFYKDDSLEPTQEDVTYKNKKVTLMTYYGLVPKEYMTDPESENNVVKMFTDEMEDYSDMVEAIIVIANGETLLKYEESPYMMKDRPVISYQADTVPNRLLGRGTAEKAYNMQVSIDGSMRSHMDSLALTSAPMLGVDATRMPRGFKWEVKPGKNIFTTGNPQEILFPMKFGMTDGQSMETSKEFERMLLMSTATIDSNGQVSQVSRDSNMDMATATMIKKYKRVLVNMQEDFIIPFIYKACWRYMQFDPERYPSVDVKFVPTATLGIIAREYEQKQLAFLVQTLGADNPITPILMQGILQNSSISNREEMIMQMQKMSQPDPQQQQMQMAEKQAQIGVVNAQAQELTAKAGEHQANAQKTMVEAQLAPDETKAKVLSAISRNLPSDNTEAEFNRRVKVSELMLKEESITSSKKIVEMQTQQKAHDMTLKERDHQLRVEEHALRKAEIASKNRPKKIKTPTGETYTVE